ncbi:Gfo/Idh/MocA family oxidoreductase [Rhodocaloribacter litoris]|uniref:Gfo/Idh/MocA family protein n=1 Tax=Rhodocaloribacter litoris TaxID=2558931 RepID=UPI00141F1248|nr:Gfo/Idh/MocA family oxidoreductase [Rhodocaloribacter litoris]QXD14605.1 Gfo/Idh/MocA family oxidoreductase [Rhodocaloribacter litoris]
MRIFNTGLIGYGGFGRFLHHAWRELDNVRIVAVADAAAPGSPEGPVPVYTDWRHLLDRPEIDVLAVATPPDTHAPIAEACMRAGKHVLIEKPLALTPSEARALIRVRDETGVVAAVDYVMRFNPLVQAFRRLTRQGAFGRLRRVAVENYAQDEQLPPSHWFWNVARSGGILVEHGVHFIDLVHFLHPAPLLAVQGLKHDRRPGQEDQVLAGMLYEGGLFATHYHAFARPGFFETTRIRLAYDLADVVLQGWIPLQGEVRALVNTRTKPALLAELPFDTLDTVPVEAMTDASRPAGWGPSEAAGPADRHRIRSGGIAYLVHEHVTGTFRLGRSKQDVYAGCVRASLQDVLHKITDPSHELTAPLEAGLASLDAARATAAARGQAAGTQEPSF